ncbi:hypothetical protein P3G55_25105, partial [Leptospira sp. 96542]|nr:hypothetical protein [Leptospira sp. 96542]
DGSLSQAEFEAGRPQPGGMPPPPPPSADANGDSDSTTDALQALLAALDTDGDQQVSAEEAQRFLDQLNAEQQAAQGNGQSTETASQRLTELVRQAYEQITSRFSVNAYGSTVNTTA